MATAGSILQIKYTRKLPVSDENQHRWTHRRLNPALALMIAQVDDRRVSKSLDGELAARFSPIMADDEPALEGVLKRMSRQCRFENPSKCPV